MTTFIWTFVLSLGFFVFFLTALMLERFFGRKIKRRCACSAAKAIVRDFQERKKRERQAAEYSPKTVDTEDLPIISQ